MKRGASQIDWVISMAIFLIYLAWFFIFISPLTTQPERFSSLISIIDENFKESVLWDVEKLPIIVSSPKDFELAPVIIDFGFNWTPSNSRFSDGTPFVVEDGKMFFLKDLSNGSNVFWLSHSDYEYEPPDFFFDLEANETEANTPTFRIMTDFYILKRLVFKAVERIHSAKYYINGVEIEGMLQNTSFYTNGIFARYDAYTDPLTHTSRVFADNTIVYSEIKMQDAALPVNFSMGFELFSYANYYSDNSFFGSFDFSRNQCYNYSSNSIDFYNAFGGLGFGFDRKVNFSFCTTNETRLFLNMSFPVYDNATYVIIAHNGSYDDFFSTLPLFEIWGSDQGSICSQLPPGEMFLNGSVAYYYRSNSDDAMLDEMEGLQADVFVEDDPLFGLDALLSSIYNYDLVVFENPHFPGSLNEKARIEPYVRKGGIVIISGHPDVDMLNVTFTTDVISPRRATIISDEPPLSLALGDQILFSDSVFVVNNSNTSNASIIAEYDNGDVAIMRWDFANGTAFYFSDFDTDYHGGTIQDEVQNAIAEMVGVLCYPYLEQRNNEVGIVRRVSGFSEEKLLNFSNQSYEGLKLDWNYPLPREFQIEIYNSTLAEYKTGVGELFFSFGKNQNDPTAKVFVRSEEDHIVDEQGNSFPAALSIKVW
ncbi:hypothetical protein D6745_05425 [Candidatus Woesearchaeota archaeon]|nr:MAG: hypothetical protein D6745_05425 [Candidatus Woesearchaeota archaeon]